MTATVAERAAGIRLLISDVDGVLTDGGLRFGPDGEQLKRFHAHDGYGLRQLKLHGIEVAILSGRASQAVNVRMQDLGITEVHQGQRNKIPVFEELLARCQLTEAQVAYVGDDVPDLPVMERCGLAVAVANAQPAVKEAAHLITERPGGAGAVREVCDLILAQQSHL